MRAFGEFDSKRLDDTVLYRMQAVVARASDACMSSCCNAVFVHEGFQHMVSNVLVWLALALPLEHAYGTPRILAVWLISALGSAFFSAAFEDSCTLVCSELCPAQHLFL